MSDYFNFKEMYSQYKTIRIPTRQTTTYQEWEKQVAKEYCNLSSSGKVNFVYSLEKRKNDFIDRNTILRDILIPFITTFIAVLIAFLTVIIVVIPVFWNLTNETMAYNNELEQNKAQEEAISNYTDKESIETIAQSRKNLNFIDRITEMSKIIERDYYAFNKMILFILGILILFGIFCVALFKYLRKNELYYMNLERVLIKIKNKECFEEENTQTETENGEYLTE